MNGKRDYTSPYVRPRGDRGSYQERDRGSYQDRDRGYHRGDRSSGNGGSSRDYGRDSRGRGNFRGGLSSRGGKNSNVVQLDQRLKVVPCSDVGSNLPRGKIEPKAEVDVKVTGFQLELRRAVEVYLYDIQFFGIRFKKGDAKETKENVEKDPGIPLSEPAKNDYSRNLKNLAFGKLFEVLREENPSVFKDDRFGYIYDRGTQFYSKSDLFPNDPKVTREFTIEMKGDLGRYEYLRGYREIVVKIKKAGHLKEINNVEKLRVVNDDARPILTYLDLLLFQHAAEQNKYYVFNSTFYLQHEENPKRLNSKSDFYDVKIGMSKGTRPIIDKDGKLQVALQVDVKFAAFYRQMKLLDFVERQFKIKYDYERIKKVIKGLFVRTVHLQRNIVFRIFDITKDPARSISFSKDGKDIKIDEYFRSHHNMNIDRDMPCIVRKKKERMEFFPIQVLCIEPGQRIDKKKMDDKLNAEMLRTCQQKPLEYCQNLEKVTVDAQLLNQNEYLNAFGVRLHNKNNVMELKAQELYPPAFQYNDGKVVELVNSGGWKTDEVSAYYGTKFERIAVLLYFVDQHLVTKFIDDLKYAAKRYGMEIRETTFVPIKYEEDFTEFIDRYGTRDYDYVLLISKDKGIKAHSSLKLSEIEKAWPTQEVLLSSCNKGRDTLQNILMKMNCKKGGINKVLTTSTESARRMNNGVDVVKSMMKDCLLIGIEFSHGSLMKRDDMTPSCVGLAYNTIDEQVNQGTYFFIKARSTIIDSSLFADEFVDILKAYHLQHQSLPKKIIVYRSGASVGQMEEISDKEIRTCYEAVFGYFSAQQLQLPPFYYLLVRRPKERYVPKNPSGGANQNVKPGTVITNGFSTPALREFTIIPHVAQLGTAKPTTVTVMYPTKSVGDITDCEYNQLVELTHNLAYTCDAVNSPIAVPGPTDAATKVAQRGMNNWNELSRTDTRFHALEGGVKPEEQENVIDELCKKWTKALKTKLNTAFWT